ncbi:MAG: T9SS type A sorting domain-containing protein [Bacteroidota bacterium]
MKRKFTKIVLSAALMFIVSTNYAATITAIANGNWSNASIWSGGTAGATVSGLDNIVIPAGITVTLDMDVQVTSILSSISVAGTLNSANSHSLMINSGTLSGNGNLNLNYLELSATGGMSFSGTYMGNCFTTSNVNLNLASQVTIMDTLSLKAGTLSLGAGSLLMLNTSATIKVEDGSLAINGGVFTATNDYDVMYVGSSKTTGIELGGLGFKDMYVQLSSASQNLTLGGDVTVTGTLHHNMGSLVIGANTLSLKLDYMSSNGSTITGSATSNLSVVVFSGTTSDFMFTSGARSLNDFEIRVNNSGNVSLGTNLAINGNLKLIKGNLNIMNSSTLTMNSNSEITVNLGKMMFTSGGNFNGTASYDVNFIGNSSMPTTELTGSGLNNISVDLNTNMDSVKIQADVIVAGTVSLTKGTLNLNSHKLEIKGNLSSTTNGMFQGHTNSDLMINTTNGLNDTIYFASSMNRLNNLSISTGNNTRAMLGSDLNVETLTFVNGGLTIYNNDLMINTTGSINGYDMTKYVAVKGTGSLMMMVNTSSPYVTFPVGTTTSYAPAQIQRTGGTSAVLGVSTHDGVWSMGTTGSDMASSLSVVDRTWDIESPTTSSVNMNVKFQWTAGMEVNSFDRTMAYVSQYTNNWDAVTPSASTVTGSNYQLARNGVTSPGQFAVVDNLSALSVKEQEDVSFSLYPNPAHNNLTVAVKDNSSFTVEVFDALGNKAIAEKMVKGMSSDIDFSSLTSGVYFVKISTDKAQSVKRVVKQ